MAHCLAPDIVSVSAQTLLFSATMPSALHEFAKAGLKDPEMVRLDTDTRISPELSTAFFTVRCGPHNSSTLCQGCAALPVSYQGSCLWKRILWKRRHHKQQKTSLLGCCLPDRLLLVGAVKQQMAGRRCLHAALANC